MDAELKELLTKLCDRLDGMERRLLVVESQSHKQITLQDYFQKYGPIPQMQPPLSGKAMPWPDQYTTIC